jgi:hypothetical protein
MRWTHTRKWKTKHTQAQVKADVKTLSEQTPEFSHGGLEQPERTKQNKSLKESKTNQKKAKGFGKKSVKQKIEKPYQSRDTFER